MNIRYLFVINIILVIRYFLASPHVLVTTQHAVVGLKHDTTTVWVQNVTTDTFPAFSRETQNFDGLHKDIRPQLFKGWITTSTG